MFCLPTALDIGDVEYPIRDKGDYRVVLDAIDALTNPDLPESGMFGNERADAAGFIFYPDWAEIEDKHQAIEKMSWFIDLGEERTHAKQKPLYDWEQDQHMIAAAVSRVCGQPIRAIPYLHWWDFVSYFYEVGEGQFSAVCAIRNKNNLGKKLEKYEKEFMQRNPHLFKARMKLSEADKEFLGKFE